MTEPIRCILTTRAISHADTSYTALSYTWNLENSTAMRQIYVNDTPFWIFNNLHSFLLQLRNRGFDTSLWADAICTQQASDIVKSAQLAFMGTIFSCVARVFAWLGPEADSSAETIDRYNALALIRGTKYKSVEEESTAVVDQNSERFRPCYNPSSTSLQSDLPGSCRSHDSPSPTDLQIDLSDEPAPSLQDLDTLWWPVRSLLNGPYWNRMWIVQELVLAESEMLLLLRRQSFLVVDTG